MHFISSLALPALSLPLLASAAACPAPKPKAAAYFLDNNPAGSSIVALTIGDDGMLSDPVRTATEGNGLYGLTASSTGGQAAAGKADTLFSQDAVVVSGNLLFTVNAGSNTLSAFTIPWDDPTHPKLLGSPADTKGEFPQAVAYSPKLKTACAINGGSVAGITCFSVSPEKGLKALGGLRPISIKQTTPPVGPPSTVSDIVFNPSQTALIATVKGDGTGAGYIYAYPVSWDGSISMQPVISRPSELALEFSISFLGQDSSAVITDPSFGAAIVSVSDKLEFTVTHKTPIAGEAAICWSTYAPQFDTIFILDGGLSNITLMDPRSGAIQGVVAGAADTAANLDAQLYGDKLYVLNGAPYVSVVDAEPLKQKGGVAKEVQNFDLSSLGSRQGFQGLAIYPS